MLDKDLSELYTKISRFNNKQVKFHFLLWTPLESVQLYCIHFEILTSKNLFHLPHIVKLKTETELIHSKKLMLSRNMGISGRAAKHLDMW